MRLQQVNYHLTTADGFELTYSKVPNSSGRTFKQLGTDTWNGEAELHTETVQIEFVWAGGRREDFELTGDQHRDLESWGLENEWLARVSDGEVPEDALEEVLQDIPRQKVA